MSFGNAQVAGLGKIHDVGMFAVKHQSGTAALVRYCELGIEIVYGYPNQYSMGGITPIQREAIRFADAPELEPLWGINGWNMHEIETLLSNGPAH